MTRKRPPLAALALIGVSALISACGSIASAGTGRGKTIAANHELAEEVAHVGVPTPSAPSGSLDVLSVRGAVTDREAAVGSLLAAHVHAENSGGVHIS
jgi:hypothetical protein